MLTWSINQRGQLRTDAPTWLPSVSDDELLLLAQIQGVIKMGGIVGLQLRVRGALENRGLMPELWRLLGGDLR